MKSLNQSEFKFKILKDLGMLYPRQCSKKKIRHVIAECPTCKKDWKISIYGLKRSKECFSCASRRRRTKHGLSKTGVATAYYGMINRCHNVNNWHFHNYGARGIKVCDEWRNSITAFYKWAIANGYSDGLTIDRRKNNEGYSPENCRWVTRKIQSRNTRKLRTTNTSGYRGVCFDKSLSGRKWKAVITVSSKKKHIGIFDSAEKAAAAYDFYVLSNNLEHTRNFTTTDYISHYLKEL